MGTWAIDAFGNDDACDWLSELDETADLSLIESALDSLLVRGSEYVEAPLAWAALAAAEVIARLQGNWGQRDAYSAIADQWVERTGLRPPPSLASKAHLAIEQILADDSELRELWEESDERDAWLASVTALKGRVRG